MSDNTLLLAPSRMSIEEFGVLVQAASRIGRGVWFEHRAGGFAMELRPLSADVQGPISVDEFEELAAAAWNLGEHMKLEFIAGTVSVEY